MTESTIKTKIVAILGYVIITLINVKKPNNSFDYASEYFYNYIKTKSF